MGNWGYDPTSGVLVGAHFGQFGNLELEKPLAVFAKMFGDQLDEANYDLHGKMGGVTGGNHHFTSI